MAIRLGMFGGSAPGRSRRDPRNEESARGMYRNRNRHGELAPFEDWSYDPHRFIERASFEGPTPDDKSSSMSATPEDERDFQIWYRDQARKNSLDPNPDAPEHKYDYRQAYLAGAEPGIDGHWPSEFKAPDHPNRFVDGVDTISGQPQPRSTPPMGMFGKGPKPRSAWADIKSDPFTFLLEGTDGIASRRDAAISEQKRLEFESMLDSMDLDPRERMAIRMNPGEYGKAVSGAYADRLKPQTSTFHDPETGEWNEKPEYMNVAPDANVYSTARGASVYTGPPKPPEPFTLGADQTRFDGDNRVIARGPPGRGGGAEVPNGFQWKNGKLEFIPGGPADPQYIDVVSDARARGIPEFSQTEQRQYKTQAQELNKFEAMLNDYFRVLKENGGPQTMEAPWNAQQRANIDSAHSLLTLGLKQAYQGGALDRGLIEIAEKIISDPTGWASLNKGGADEFKKAADPVFNQIAYARAQIPDQFRTGVTTQAAAPAPGPQAAAAPGSLKPGTVEEGMIYLGGDPGEESSWAPMRQ